MSRSRRNLGTLQAIPENEEQAPRAGPVAEILSLIDDLDAQVEARIASIMSAAEDAIVSIRNELKAKMVRLPKATREMPLKDFQEKFPGDFKTGALQEIRERYAAMAAAAHKAVPATAARGMRTAKRGAEPETALRTVRPRRGGPVAPPPRWDDAAAPAPAPVRAAPDGSEAAAAPSQPPTAHEPVPAFRSAMSSTAAPGMHGSFNGLPLQTPMPFAGAAAAMPVTMLTQKRGGRTKAAAVPDAALITTADGLQWALGKGGMASIPETHRAEVTELLSAQFEFLAAALGKTVFSRGGRRG